MLCLIFIAFIAIANLRGVRESGALFATPTYVFIVSFLFMVAFGLFHYFVYGGSAPVPSEEEFKTAEGYSLQPLTLFLLLGAFSNGCAALTGIEAISNGVQAFKKPESRNAATTLVWMAVLLTVMFLGTSVMAYLYHVHPKQSETVISQFARIMGDRVQAVYVDFGENATANLKEKWERLGAGVQLVVLPSPYRELTRPLLRYINRLSRENSNDMITVVLPEFIPAKWWQHVLHNQSSLLLKGSLLFKKGVIVTSVPYHLDQ